MAIHTFIGNASEWPSGDIDPERDFRIEYEGCVLQTYERNGYDDSDFMAIVYDAATDSIREVCYATTRGWTYANGAVVDALPNIVDRAQHIVYEAKVAAVRAAYYAEARKPAIGKAVKVTATKTGKDRKIKGEVVPAGTTGVVFWIGPDRYDYYATRIGIQLDEGRHVIPVETPDDGEPFLCDICKEPATHYSFEAGSQAAGHLACNAHRLTFGDPSVVFGKDDIFDVECPEQYELTEIEIRDRLGSPSSITSFYTSRPGVINMVS